MGGRINPALIGAFVLGALALVVAGAVFFTAGRFDVKTDRFVIFFDDSVRGLGVGAPLILRGVTIGRVVEIQALFNAETNRIEIPVIVEVERNIVQVSERSGITDLDADEAIAVLIGEGMRARLIQQSFVTGQMNVELDFHPHNEPKFVGTDLPYPQIPAVPSLTSQLEATIGSIAQTLPAVIANGNRLLDRATELLSPERVETATRVLDNLDRFTAALGESEGDVRTMLSKAASVMTQLETSTAKLDAVIVRAETTLAGFGKVAQSAEALVTDTGRNVTLAAQELRTATASIRGAADTIGALLTENRDSLNDFMEGGIYDLQVLIVDATAMVNSINRVAELIERDPSRFFFGEQVRGVQTND